MAIMPGSVRMEKFFENERLSVMYRCLASAPGHLLDMGSLALAFMLAVGYIASALVGAVFRSAMLWPH